ncbi:hypothetical protein RQP46_011430 [Phenoliferia psychrophenolica]
MRDLAARGETPASLGLVPGSQILTIVEFHANLLLFLKAHESTFSWALYQALELDNSANHPSDHVLPTSLIFYFSCTDLVYQAGYAVSLDEVTRGPIASYRETTPGEWPANYALGVVTIVAPGDFHLKMSLMLKHHTLSIQCLLVL